MKKLFISGIAMLASYASSAQTDTASVEQYCQVIATSKLFSNKVTIDIDFGKEKSYWKDTRLKTSEGVLRQFNTIIDAMNYMGREGWIFISAFPVHVANGEQYHFAFKTKVLLSEPGNK